MNPLSLLSLPLIERGAVRKKLKNKIFIATCGTHLCPVEGRYIERKFIQKITKEES